MLGLAWRKQAKIPFGKVLHHSPHIPTYTTIRFHWPKPCQMVSSRALTFNIFPEVLQPPRRGVTALLTYPRIVAPRHRADRCLNVVTLPTSNPASPPSSPFLPTCRTTKAGAQSGTCTRVVMSMGAFAWMHVHSALWMRVYGRMHVSNEAMAVNSLLMSRGGRRQRGRRQLTRNKKVGSRK